MRRRTILAIAANTGLVAIAGCGESSDGSDEAATPDEQTTPEDEGGGDDGGDESTDETPNETEGTPETQGELERESVGYPSEYIEVRDVAYNEPEDEYSGPTITGVADNVSGEELSYVEVQIQAFNENDEQIGDALDNTTDLREGKSWRFECEFWDVEESEMAYWMGRAEVSNY